MPKSESTLPESQVAPNPFLEKRTRRQFTADYKLRMITGALACKRGELAALLRSETRPTIRFTRVLRPLENPDEH